MKALKNSHPNVIIPKRSKKLKHILNSGLFVASKHPVEYLDQEIFSDCKSPDCLSSKRAILVEMTMPNGKKVQFLNTHLQASYGGENEKFSAIRAKQLEQIKKLMERNKKEGVPQILIGDLNIDGFKYKETEFKSSKEIVDMNSVDLSPTLGRSTSVMNHCFKKEQNKEPKWIDHIWYKSNGAQVNVTPLEIVPVRGILNECECALSDHEPIEAKFSIDSSSK